MRNLIITHLIVRFLVIVLASVSLLMVPYVGRTRRATLCYSLFYFHVSQT